MRSPGCFNSPSGLISGNGVLRPRNDERPRISGADVSIAAPQACRHAIMARQIRTEEIVHREETTWSGR